MLIIIGGFMIFLSNKFRHLVSFLSAFILSLVLLSGYAMAHCGGCGTGDKHDEGEKCQKGSNDCKSGLVCKLKEGEFVCQKEENDKKKLGKKDKKEGQRK